MNRPADRHMGSYRTIETLTDDEADKLLDRLEKGVGTVSKKKIAARDYCISVLLLDAGLRVGELVKLELNDLILGGEPVKALCIRAEIAKGKHKRLVPLTERARRAIRSMQAWLWNIYNTNEPQWAFRNSYSFDALSTRQVQRIIKVAAIASIGRPIHPHVLRHTFASNLMRVTNARVVQELLGHKNLTTTQIYTHPNGNDLEEAIKKTEKGGQ